MQNLKPLTKKEGQKLLPGTKVVFCAKEMIISCKNYERTIYYGQSFVVQKAGKFYLKIKDIPGFFAFCDFSLPIYNSISYWQKLCNQ